MVNKGFQLRYNVVNNIGNLLLLFLYCLCCMLYMYVLYRPIFSTFHGE